MSDFSDRPFVAGVLTGLRAFRIDSLGRLTGVTYKDVWPPGENVAQCHAKPDYQQIARMYATTSTAWTVSSPLASGGSVFPPSSPYYITSMVPSRDKPISKKQEEAAKKDHTLAGLACQCGFYAYFDGGNDYLTDPSAVGYASMFGYTTADEDRAPRVGAVVNAWGLATVGSRGFRAEKAEVVALIVPASTAARHEVAFTKARRNYPDVQVFDTEKEAVRAFPLTDAAPYTPDTDPDFWTRSAS